MDTSKLPRLSRTEPTRNDESPGSATPQAAIPVRNIPQANPADVWISIAVGAIMLLMYPRFLQWVSSKLFHTNFNPFLKPDGTVVPYTQVPEFWGDLGPTLFGIVLIVEGIALAVARKRAVMIFAFGLTLLATGYNLIYLILSFSTYGLPIVSALAVAFGVYIAMYQWKLINPTPLPGREGLGEG